ncbi:MAG: MBL fold metallo-hydrolase [Cycloclasticus sp. symbiont of Poecilosclerida sp. M]|nr:MAG: MBL fold metallo-hydrolase [Cycloclasticus sp. symbiont of Poecilosclerida sp. M]
MLRVINALLISLCLPLATLAAEFDYQLNPVKVVKDTYIFEGKTEDFTFGNGGNIVNTGFIVTSNGVVVIDTGPSLRYGEQMRKAISNVTKKPILRVYLTHHHPDHFLGNQAFKGIPIYALGETITSINNEGAGFTDNLYLMVGDWMRGTDSIAPTKTVEPGVVNLGGHKIEILGFSGHTVGDLAIFDHTTGALFSGDLIFHKRTLTTPHANISLWLETIAALKKKPFKVLIPGHGPKSLDKQAMDDVSDYLRWIDVTFKKASEDGLSMTELMAQPIPKQFSGNALLKEEFSRSVTHLYAKYEQAVFKRAN